MRSQARLASIDVAGNQGRSVKNGLPCAGTAQTVLRYLLAHQGNQFAQGRPFELGNLGAIAFRDLAVPVANFNVLKSSN